MAAIPPVLLVGCGRMGRAMLAGWREAGLAPSLAVDPAPAALDCADAGLRVLAGPEAIEAGFEPAAIVFAIKPQHAAEIVGKYRRFSGRAVYLSIMAGRTLAGLHDLLGPEAGLVRAMPNLPAAVRQGMTVACRGVGVTEAQRVLCDRLLSVVGTVAWVEDESLLDAVTAVSGSGPAYVFLLTELLEQAARAEGVPAELARLLARRTVAGAGALLAASDADASALRRGVTSPGGTTERALAVLMADEAWPALVRRAVGAAADRGRELAGERIVGVERNGG